MFNVLNSVKKKRATSDDVIAVCDAVHTFETEEAQNDTPICGGMKLLGNKEFELETGGYQSEPEDDEHEPERLEDTLYANGKPDNKKTVSKKRKALKKLKSPKYVSILLQYISLIHILAFYLVFLSACA